MLPKSDRSGLTTTGKHNASIGRGEVTIKNSCYDKQTGNYSRVTTKESLSSGDYVNRGKLGYKDEFKTSSTVRVGSKTGYTEYSKQEKFTRVDYGQCGGRSICGSNKAYSDDDGGGDPDNCGEVNDDCSNDKDSVDSDDCAEDQFDDDDVSKDQCDDGDDDVFEEQCDDVFEEQCDDDDVFEDQYDDDSFGDDFDGY